MIDEAQTRSSTVSRGPGVGQKMIDGAVAPCAHGPAEVAIAAAIVIARIIQNARKYGG